MEEGRAKLFIYVLKWSCTLSGGANSVRYLSRGSKTATTNNYVWSSTNTYQNINIANALGEVQSTPHVKHTNSFLIPIDKIAACSPFFFKAFNSGFEESRSKTIYFPVEDALTLQSFHNWLFVPELFKDLVQTQSFFQMVKLWIFGERHAVLALQNETMRIILEALDRPGGRTITGEIIQYAYENTMADSPLRKLLVDLAVSCMDEQSYRMIKDELSADFCDDVTLGFIKMRDTMKLRGVVCPSQLHLCVYEVLEHQGEFGELNIAIGTDVNDQKSSKSGFNQTIRTAADEQRARRSILVPKSRTKRTEPDPKMQGGG